MQRFEVQTPDAGTRLDVWLERRLPDLSRSRIQSLLHAGHITVDGKTAKPHRKVRAGMYAAVEVPAPVPVTARPQDLPLVILYEDADVIVVDKAAGMVVHPAAGHADGTLVNALLFHCRDLAGVNGELRPGIVHRLDRDTSGVLVAAKTGQALQNLQKQFKAGRVEKEYVALVRGAPPHPEGRIETLIGRSRQDRKKMAVQMTTGRKAISHYKVEATCAGVSRVRVRIETGRTHQIRVHMAHIGCPVIGDPQYGGRRSAAPVWAARQMLHAESLSFLHPRTGRRLRFHADPPEDMRALISRMESTTCL
jgi:23S rRNA pseudouridine1911/1915/1917 synthase